MSANTQPSILNVNGFSNALRIAWDATTAGVGAVIFIFELVVSSVASLFLFLIAFVWAVPIIGRLLRQLWGFC